MGNMKRFTNSLLLVAKVTCLVACLLQKKSMFIGIVAKLQFPIRSINYIILYIFYICYRYFSNIETLCCNFATLQQPTLALTLTCNEYCNQLQLTSKNRQYDPKNNKPHPQSNEPLRPITNQNQNN